MDVTVREAVPDDAPRIRAVHLDAIEALGGEAYSDEQVAAWAHDRDPAEYPIETTETHAVVAEREKRLVGFGWMRPDAEEYLKAPVDGEITAVYVDPSVARQGVGTRLCTELEAAARRHGVESLGLWASRNAVPFYEAQGYRRVTEHTIGFGDGVEGTVVEMQKQLTSER
ncbi:MAG: acetyltransferase [halophilic archaeon J07HX64]|jgi:Acetyltransferases|nr:MAG: acetyltransferase [halophilic archaeon J07HX64]